MTAQVNHSFPISASPSHWRNLQSCNDLLVLHLPYPTFHNQYDVFEGIIATEILEHNLRLSMACSCDCPRYDRREEDQKRLVVFFP
jgi:hypothetical protein